MSSNQAEKPAEQEPTREELIEQQKKRNEYLLDLENLKPQQHIWVDRGHVMSCEGAGHPNHRAFKRLR